MRLPTPAIPILFTNSAPQDRQHTLHAGSPERRQAVAVRPADQHRLRSQRECLDHVGAAPDTAIEHYWNSTGGAFHHLRQRFDSASGLIQLPASVIGYNHALGSRRHRLLRGLLCEDGFDDHRQPGQRNQFLHVFPGRRTDMGGVQLPVGHMQPFRGSRLRQPALRIARRHSRSAPATVEIIAEITLLVRVKENIDGKQMALAPCSAPLAFQNLNFRIVA